MSVDTNLIRDYKRLILVVSIARSQSWKRRGPLELRDFISLGDFLQIIDVEVSKLG
jgi:hypothetical protein